MSESVTARGVARTCAVAFAIGFGTNAGYQLKPASDDVAQRRADDAAVRILDAYCLYAFYRGVLLTASNPDSAHLRDGNLELAAVDANRLYARAATRADNPRAIHAVMTYRRYRRAVTLQSTIITI